MEKCGGRRRKVVKKEQSSDLHSLKTKIPRVHPRLVWRLLPLWTRTVPTGVEKNGRFEIYLGGRVGKIWVQTKDGVIKGEE